MLKITAAISLLVLFTVSSAQGQYYLRGEVRDEKNNALSNAKILLHSTRFVYYSGSSGTFGITSSRLADSITISLEGYQPLCVRIETGKYQNITLKMLYSSVNLQKNKLVSVTRNLHPDDRNKRTLTGETYSSLVENEFISARKYPETGCAIHTDKASYSNIRRFLGMNTTVPTDAVRIEELLNYFSFDYTPPPPDSTFGFKSYLSDCPWNPLSRLLYIHASARKIDPEKIPPTNLVFLIDVSGSMDMPNRLPLLKSAFKLLVDNLREKDTVSIVVYGSSVGVWLVPTSGIEKEKIRKSIEDLYPGGSTPGESGIRTAYRLAKSQFIPGGNNRVILATDGDFNVGQTSEDELEKLITQHQQSGIYLTCLGVGMGNYKDSKLEILAKKGNGNFAYLDNEKEAEKVLVKELTQTLYTVADDAFLNVSFNPSVIREYRLIGFDNKVNALADSLSEVEGGEVGSGHSLLAMFELVPLSQSLDWGHAEDGLAKVTLNYKKPGDSLGRSTTYISPLAYTKFTELPKSYRFATAVTMFAGILKNSPFMKQVTWNDASALASEAQNPQDAIQAEFITMIAKAKKIYGHRKRKKLLE
ncbi:von Willebrand factor type A domain-containing protein [Paraflavitalea sp. CAU 1676]|uniref:YfbK domain-containing protein n=1 Tax=Paraflavitalea sp. CAU 1676 TaxID=3032598 RepID=UPI0023DBD38F|nr:von Willebrand factor type A domain-containing protein [Paraflavitalea sp. CAU 1676]MDF2187523.1 von Willebrand factor type A domain-containing protein [Paraflavitalea sp. CAU 1676]